MRFGEVPSSSAMRAYMGLERMEPPAAARRWLNDFLRAWPFTETARRLFATINFEAADLSREHGGGYWFPSPVLHKGLLYAIDDRGVFSVLEADSGKLVYEERVDIGGRHYPSISVAGDNVYLSSDNGATLVVKAGRKYEAIGQNELDPFRSSLVFEGQRMYVRTQKHLYCIGE